MEDRAKFERRVAGALRSTIDAHGPITKQWIGSATKRIVSEIKALEREERSEAGGMGLSDGLGA
jgi:hypothetical protein